MNPIAIISSLLGLLLVYKGSKSSATKTAVSTNTDTEVTKTVNPNLVSNSSVGELSSVYGFAKRTVSLVAGKTYTFSVNGYATSAALSASQGLVAFIIYFDNAGKWAWEDHISITSASPETKFVSFVAPYSAEYMLLSYPFNASITQSERMSLVNAGLTKKVYVAWYKVEEGSEFTGYLKTSEANSASNTNSSDPRDSKLYFGSKTSPYEKFYDFSGNSFGDQNAINSFALSNRACDIVRARTTPRLFCIEKSSMNIPLYGENFSNQTGFRYLGYTYHIDVAVEFFNPSSYPINVTGIVLNRVQYNYNELNVFYVGGTIPFAFRMMGGLNVVSPGNGDFTIPAHGSSVRAFTFGEKLNFVRNFDCEKPLVTSNGIKYRTFPEIALSDNSGMISFNCHLFVNGQNDVKSDCTFGLYAGNEPTSTIEEFWTRRYVGDNSNSVFVGKEQNISNQWAAALAAYGV